MGVLGLGEVALASAVSDLLPGRGRVLLLLSVVLAGASLTLMLLAGGWFRTSLMPDVLLSAALVAGVVVGGRLLWSAAVPLPPTMGWWPSGGVLTELFAAAGEGLTVAGTCTHSSSSSIGLSHRHCHSKHACGTWLHHPVGHNMAVISSARTADLQVTKASAIPKFFLVTVAGSQQQYLPLVLTC